MRTPTSEIPLHLRFWWFEGDTMHFDAPRYAKLRGITVAEAMAELQELAGEAMPDTPISVTD
jgi:hypothetical protein